MPFFETFATIRELARTLKLRMVHVKALLIPWRDGVALHHPIMADQAGSTSTWVARTTSGQMAIMACARDAPRAKMLPSSQAFAFASS